MNSNQVFIGNIKKCTKYKTPVPCNCNKYINHHDKSESEITKKNAVLIKVVEGGYVDIDSYNSALDYFKVRQSISKKSLGINELILSTSPYQENCLFIDSSSLRPYYQKEESKIISLRNLKKEVITSSIN